MDYNMQERVAAAIMRAFFSRPVDLQVINVTVADQLDIARAAIDEMRKLPVIHRLAGNV
jgi:hypothetical protein